MKRKSWTVSLLLSIFCGAIGIDRFYLGYTGMGLLKLFTGGGLGIIALIDLIRIATKSLQPADGMGYEEDAMNEMNRDYYQEVPLQYDSAEELLKYKKLLDAGAITEEEYAMKKREILGNGW